MAMQGQHASEELQKLQTLTDSIGSYAIAPPTPLQYSLHMLVLDWQLAA